MGVHRRRWLCILAAVAIASVGLTLPAVADLGLIAGDEARVAYTDGDGVYLRDAPEPGATAIWGLPEGTMVTIGDGPVEASDGSFWYAVSAETGDGTVSGWMSADYLSAEASVVPPPFFDQTAASGVPVYLSAGGGLNVRSGPSLDSEIVTTIPDGAAVVVLAPVVIDEAGIAWSVVNYDGVVGYSAADFLGGLATGGGQINDGLLMVTGTGGDGLSVREGPDISQPPLSVLAEGTLALLLDGPVSDATGGSWYQIEAAEVAGWASDDYLAAASSATSSGGSAAGAEIVNAALGYIGVPYVWAGTTPAGFDCSGFTWFVVSNVVDANFPRPNEDQVEYGSEVAVTDLAPGDLIFFQNTYQWGLSHVGIYIGNGQFVSASGEHDSVGISSLSDPYWATRYVTARRVG